MIYLKLFYIFFKVGLIGFGGGYAILPMIYQDVQAFGIITADEFSNLVALSQVTPGPIAINAATYVGFKSAGLLGAIVASVGVSMPSFILIMIVMSFINRFKENRVVQAVLAGIKPATIGLMASAFMFMATTALFNDEVSICNFKSIFDNVNIVAVAIFILIFALIRLTRLGAITLTLLGGVLGVVVGIIIQNTTI